MNGVQSVALRGTHLPQKTLHNFRPCGRLAFQNGADSSTSPESSLDSTHIMSNIATLTRLGLLRPFLRAVKACGPRGPEALLEGRSNAITPPGEGRRTCVPIYRLVDGFRGTALEGWRGCCGSGGGQRDGRPNDDDAGEGAVPSPSGTPSDSLQSPHVPPTAGTKARGTRYRWRRPAMRRTPPS